MGIEEKLALEAVKPATGFLNAVLAPKIEKVKEWAEEKELKGKLEPNSLSKILENYLTKLSRKVSEITTISFPLQKLNIFDAYEPLYVEEIRAGGKVSDKVSVESILFSNRSSCLIIDSAGMGKSTFSKYFVSQVLLKTDRIPLFFELRKLRSDNELLEELARELDSIGKQFSRDLFYELIKLGKFVVILDGFDEVDLDFQENLASQISSFSLHGGGNKLLLTSRPQETLPDLNDSTSYRFCGFSIEQATSLILRYDKISKLDVGARLIEELDSVPEKFIETPLLVSLLYRTFGTNNSIADRVCTFYDEIYHALYKGHDLMNKNGYIREKKSGLDFEDFRRLLRSLCYYMAVKRKNSFDNWSEAILYIGKAIEMSSVKPSSPSNFLDDLLVAVPLMQRDGAEYKFLHKTILEFFCAEYIIFRTDSFDLCEKIFKSRMFSSFNKVFDFIYDISPELYNRVVTNFHALNLLEICDSEISDERILKTLKYLQESKVGLWEADEYSEYYTDSEGNKKRRFANHIDHEDEDFKNGYFSLCWTDVLMDDIPYFLVISSKDRNSLMHDCAWDQISDKLEKNYYFDYGIKNKPLEIILDIDVNEWHLISDELMDVLLECKPVIDLSVRALRSNRLYLYDSDIYIFSPEKAYSIIDKIKIESSIDNELNDLLI